MKNTTPRSYRRWLTSAAFLLTTVLVTAAMTVSGFSLHPGDLDPTFGSGGKVIDGRGAGFSAVAVQVDGQIVSAGGTDGGLVAVARYNPDGTLDMTFGSGGLVTTSIGGYDGAGAWEIAIQPDGKIIVLGCAAYLYDYSCTNFLVRYNSSGSLDATFGFNGIVDPAGLDSPGLAIQPDGKIVISGSDVVRRLNSNGSLDTTFDGDGSVRTPIFPTRSVAVQSDGKIVAAGAVCVPAPPASDCDFGIVRYSSNGSLDTTFDGDGKATTDFDSLSDSISTVALQPDGKIIAVGRSTTLTLSNANVAVARYNPDGSLDTTFDSDGKVLTFVRQGYGAGDVAIQADGKVLCVSSTALGSNNDFVVVRYNANGSLDTSFGNGNGISTVDFSNSNDYSWAMALDGEGRAMVVGQSNGSFALARFLLEARQNAPFDFDGDGRSDISLFRPSDSVWYLNRSTQGFFSTQFGLATDQIVPADYDGDGKTDIAVFRDGVWWLRKSSNGAVEPITFGQAGDSPVQGDFTGDGRDELAVFRNGQWWAFDLSNNQSSLINFGLATDKPVPADYDGDGKVDQAVYRNGEWHINRSTLGYTVASFGLPTDRPVVGDYDGDGRSDLAVYRDGTWYLQQSTAGFSAFQWGLATDIPVPADYDGDGKTDAAVYRDGLWYLLKSTAGISIQHFGLSGDKPIPSAFLQ